MVFIEYFGLQGDPDYDEKIKEKQRICMNWGIDLISVCPSDLVSIAKLESKLKMILQKAPAEAQYGSKKLNET